jgi:hypothetical protein
MTERLETKASSRKIAKPSVRLGVPNHVTVKALRNHPARLLPGPNEAIDIAAGRRLAVGLRQVSTGEGR